MSCTITIPFQQEAATILNMARQAIQNGHGQLTGDESAGTFDVEIAVGKIVATYTIKGQELEVTVLKKPLLVPCRTIEKFLQKQLSE